MEKYSIGLDIGSNSVGWAVVNQENKLVKKNGFTLWGVRMFDEAKDASERRAFRNSRRRLKRRKERLDILRSFFNEEINKVDEHFFERLDDSFFKINDKRNKNKYNLFCDEYTDYDYFKAFPTIFHLREHLIKLDDKVDIRALYLAIHHIMKYRGNFLYYGDEFKKQNNDMIYKIINDINDCIVNLESMFEEYVDYFSPIEISDDKFFNSLQSIITSSSTKNDKKIKLINLFNVGKKTLVNECFIPLLVGSNVNISKLTIIKEYNYEKVDLCISDEAYLNNVEEGNSKIKELSNLFEILPLVKEIVDHYYLLSLLGDSDYISESMVRLYDEHQNDLKLLKDFIKKFIPSKYNECFRVSDPKLNNYCRYIGMNQTGDVRQRTGHCKREEFYKYLNDVIFNNVKEDDAKDDIEYFTNKINSTNFLLRQNSDQNGALPMQLNLIELKKILEKQAKYYGFLNVSDGEYTVIEKIILTFKYKIPYYVGPLSKDSTYGWIKRSDEKIYPWNFDKVVNIDETAKEFILRMQNKCSYLKGNDDYCLPKKSLLFSEYNCLQYINKININGSLIPQDMKMSLFNEVFLNNKKPSKKNIKDFIKSNYGSDVFDLPEVNCDMSSYITFREIFGSDFNNKINIIEDIIRDIVIFEDKNILERRLREIYKLNNDTIKLIKNLNYKGYGSLCYRLLNGIESFDPTTGEANGTIIDVLRKTNLNLQQVLYDPNYNFNKVIDEYNNTNLKDDNEKDFEDFIKNHVYVSPFMKRALIQAYTIIEEVEKILNQKIDKYYVECTRHEDKKDIKSSRYEELKKLYNSCNEIALNYNVNMKLLKDRLEKNKDNLRSDKLYLYFTQLGKCMYTLDNIDFDSLINNNVYDIDHIYPQSIIKDDSLKNRVLVKKEKNSLKDKKFIFEIEGFISNREYDFYDKLHKIGLISKHKYERLVKKELSQSELDSFVNRQIVSTNQAVKGLIEVLKLYKKVDSSNIIYSKAKNISDFRKKYDLIKSRSANNYHHAHDAYLNAVVGRALNDYYIANYFIGANDVIRMQNENKSLNPMVILDSNRIIRNRVIWNKDEMIRLIKHTLYERFDVKETVRTYNPNELYGKVTIIPANDKNPVPIRETGPLSNTMLYGGVTSNSYCKYVIIKTLIKNEYEFILEAIPKSYKNKEEKYLDTIYNDYKVVYDNIKTNAIVLDNKLKYCITGKSESSYYIKNMKDRNFNYNDIKTIRNIDKYNDNIKSNTYMLYEDDKIIISPKKDGKSSLIKITKEMIDQLYFNYKNILAKDIYTYSSTQKVLNNLPMDLDKLILKDKIFVVSELLTLLKTNERGSANLKSLGLAVSSGILTISKKLKPGMKFISESVTGYYSKVLFEVPNGI